MFPIVMIIYIHPIALPTLCARPLVCRCHSLEIYIVTWGVFHVYTSDVFHVYPCWRNVSHVYIWDWTTIIYVKFGRNVGYVYYLRDSRKACMIGEVTVFWVPAHSGIEGNEIADQFAKEAASGLQRSVPDQQRWEASLSHLSESSRRTARGRPRGGSRSMFGRSDATSLHLARALGGGHCDGCEIQWLADTTSFCPAMRRSARSSTRG